MELGNKKVSYEDAIKIAKETTENRESVLTPEQIEQFKDIMQESKKIYWKNILPIK